MIGYETTIIASPETSDETNKAFVEKLKGIIQAHNGQLITVEDWGRRKLSYPIEKETRGQYIHLYYTGNNALVAELERNIRINEQIMRFLTISLGKDFDVNTHKRGPTPITPPAPQAPRDYDHGAH